VSEALTAFLADGVSVVVSSGGAGGWPAVARALGCTVAADGRRVTVFLAESASQGLLAATAAGGQVAVVVTKPSTHRSIQIKGRAAARVPLPADARAVLAHHGEAFARDLLTIGYDRRFTRTLMDHDPADVVAVAFTPCGIFDQTPGPNAGSAVAS